jgi:hypothetical protein
VYPHNPSSERKKLKLKRIGQDSTSELRCKLRVQSNVQLKNSICFKWVQIGSYEFGPYTQNNLWNTTLCPISMAQKCRLILCILGLKGNIYTLPYLKTLNTLNFWKRLIKVANYKKEHWAWGYPMGIMVPSKYESKKLKSNVSIWKGKIPTPKRKSVSSQ